MMATAFSFVTNSESRQNRRTEEEKFLRGTGDKTKHGLNREPSKGR